MSAFGHMRVINSCFSNWLIWHLTFYCLYWKHSFHCIPNTFAGSRSVIFFFFSKGHLTFQKCCIMILNMGMDIWNYVLTRSVTMVKANHSASNIINSDSLYIATFDQSILDATDVRCVLDLLYVYKIRPRYFFYLSSKKTLGKVW